MERVQYLSFKEEFLTCSICTNVFTKPCTLRCGHSFCCGCLSRFLLTRQDAIQAKRIPCAYCRQFTPTPSPSRPVTEWAGQIQCSLLLKGLLDRFNRGNKDGGDVCFLCEVVGEATPAASWCSDCEVTLCNRCKVMHLKGPSTNNHDLFDLNKGQQVKQQRKLKCKMHEGEKMTFYCKDCSICLCPTCCVLKHRSCRDVVRLKHMIPLMEASLEKFRERLETKTNEQVIVERIAQARITQLTLTRDNNVSKLKSLFKKAIDMLQDKLKKATDSTEKEFDDQISKHKTTLKTAQDAIKLHKGHCQFIEKALQTEKELVEAYQLCQSGALDIPNTPQLTTSSDSCPALNTDAFDTVIGAIEKLQMGVLTKPSLKQSYDAPSKEVFFTRNIFIRHRDDSRTPRIGEVTLQDIEDMQCVIVTDINNECLKSFFDENLRLFMRSRLKLSAKPWRISRHDNSKVVTTLGNRKIAVVEAHEGLRLLFQIETRKQYLGITSLLGGLLAVSSNSAPYSVDIIDMAGNVLKSLTSSHPGLDLMDNPFNLCSTPDGNICVTDAMSKLIHCVTPMGEVVFTYMPTHGRGCSNVIETSRGYLLVTDYDSNGIYLLDRQGRFVKDNLKFRNPVVKPLSVVSSKSGNLFVCEDDSKIIKVFTLDETVTI